MWKYCYWTLFHNEYDFANFTEEKCEKLNCCKSGLATQVPAKVLFNFNLKKKKVISLIGSARLFTIYFVYFIVSLLQHLKQNSWQEATQYISTVKNERKNTCIVLPHWKDYTCKNETKNQFKLLKMSMNIWKDVWSF